MSAHRKPRRRRSRVLTAAVLALAAAGAGAVALWLGLPDPGSLGRDIPRTTALIEQRRAEAREKRRPFHPRQTWVPLERVSPRLIDAVVLSEDSGFWSHAGVDWEATRLAAREDLARGRYARGASTITQQLAKNLWLGTGKSLWRKAKEAVLALKLERRLSKRRILGLYLNVAEWGEGVFGIEAGSRAHFGTAAADLTTAQAVVLASMLPAPRRVDLGHPSTWLARRARRLLDRMRAVGRLSPEEHLHASAELERILAGPAPLDDREEPPEEEPPAASVPQNGGSGTAGQEAGSAAEEGGDPHE
ncbi:MAG TPA: monofunctional biosynthetic peptidoglycan transglycosylase [Anaeromyxobacter sp.]|nr:monofunctional biosynthetic peptidoglycan transglycosylase [Anaeromyxobacter sp.]